MNVISPDEWLRSSTLRQLPPRQLPTPTPSAHTRTLENEIKHPAKNISNKQDIYTVAVDVLSESFGFARSLDFLKRSPHSLGLQSMDSIRFAEILSRRAGLDIPLWAFVSDLTLEKILQEAASQGE